jgi:hypothetical protein
VALIGTIAVVVSVLVLAYQGRELAGHTKIANEVAATQAHRELLLHWKSILDVFVQYPELHPMYFGRGSRQPTEDDAVRLDVIAEQFADWMDTTLMTERQLRSYVYRDWVGGWGDFTASAVAASPVLRALVRSRPNEWPLLERFVAEFDSAHPQPAQVSG